MQPFGLCYWNTSCKFSWRDPFSSVSFCRGPRCRWIPLPSGQRGIVYLACSSSTLLMMLSEISEAGNWQIIITMGFCHGGCEEHRKRCERAKETWGGCCVRRLPPLRSRFPLSTHILATENDMNSCETYVCEMDPFHKFCGSKNQRNVRRYFRIWSGWDFMESAFEGLMVWGFFVHDQI